MYLLIVCVVCVRMSGTCVEVRRQRAEVGFLLPHRFQAWQQTPLLLAGTCWSFFLRSSCQLGTCDSHAELMMSNKVLRW